MYRCLARLFPAAGITGSVAQAGVDDTGYAVDFFHVPSPGGLVPAEMEKPYFLMAVETPALLEYYS